MARKALGVSQEEVVKKEDVKDLENRLKKLIPDYGTNKSKADELKAIIDDGNKEIKRICKELSIADMEVDGWKMNYSVVTKHHVNEDRMLEILKEYWSKNGSMECPYIKRIECVDSEAVQNAMYNGDFDKETLLKLRACDEEKQEEKLRISKVKEKK